MANILGIVDYGVGNLLSVTRAFQALGIKPNCTNDPSLILRCSHLVLPGVGAFGSAINVLRGQNLDSVILEFVASGKPLLGICLGMQLLFDKSLEFGEHRGLGLMPGKVLPIEGFLSKNSKIPSIGWKKLDLTDGQKDPQNIYTGMYFYFVHSYMGIPSHSSHLVATYRYEELDIPAVVKAGNVTGVQFHPEKSGPDGLRLLQEFVGT